MRHPILTAAAVALLATTGLKILPTWAFDPQHDSLSDGLAYKVGLASLKNSDHDELRLWFMPSQRSEFAGYVVTSEGIARCRSSSRELGVRDGTCEFAGNRARARRILDLLPQFSRDDFGRCTALDGETVQVEGVLSGRHFDYQLYSPYNCVALFQTVSDLTTGDNWRAP